MQGFPIATISPLNCLLPSFDVHYQRAAKSCVQLGAVTISISFASVSIISFEGGMLAS